jgi:anti-anti-sigma regulatory factor
MEMQKERMRIGDAHVVTVTGRLDGIYGSAFANQVGELITGTNPKILIDFTDIDYVSSARGCERSCCS